MDVAGPVGQPRYPVAHRDGFATVGAFAGVARLETHDGPFTT